MPPKLPTISGKEVVRRLEKLGFIVALQMYLRIFKQFLLKYRVSCLLISIFISIFLVFLCFYLTEDPFINIIFSNERIRSGIFFLLLALFPSFYLWYLRNHDKLTQIQFTNLSTAMQLFVSKNKTSKAIGLKLLMELKHEKLYENQIDLATQGCDLSGVNLKGANLQGANLQGAHLQKANLQGADLQGAKLQGANLEEANLQGADLQGAKLQGANLEEANLQGADLQGVNLQGVDLQGANLQGAKLQRANLQNAFLYLTNLNESNLEHTNIEQAYILVEEHSLLLDDKAQTTTQRFSRDQIEQFIREESVPISNNTIYVKIIKDPHSPERYTLELLPDNPKNI
jgi:uncharacterized protein YjbI with pentapeptide repeats